MNKKYLVITPFFPSKGNFRGPYVLDQVKAIKKVSNYEVRVLRPKPLFSMLQDYQYDGVSVHYFKRVVLPSNIFPGLFKWLSKHLFFRKLRQLNIDPKDIAVAHAHVTENGYYANILKEKQPKIKTVLQHHGFDVLSLENGILRSQSWHRISVKKHGVSICNQIDLHVGVSKKTLEYLTSFSNIEISKSYVLYNGVDFSKFHPISKENNSKNFVIGCVANFWTLKDQLTLLKASKIFLDKNNEDFELKLVGTGPTLVECKSYVSKNNLSNYVKFIDEIPNDELVNFYNSLDIFVLPSLHEAFGCVYTEAYACGVPFIGVENQGISEFIPQDESKDWLIKKGDYQNLAHLLLEFKTSRKTQKLLYPVDIDFHVSKYLSYLKSSLYNA